MRESASNRARQKELEFYEQAIKYFDQVAKRKGVAMEEEGLTKGTRGHEEAFTSSGFPAQSSSSSSGGTASAGSGVAGGERRGEKRAAEDPAADGREDSVDEKGESKNDEDVSMDCMSFQEYCDTGGLWMVACREPDEDIEEGEGGELSEGQAPDQCGMQFHDVRTGKPLDAEKGSGGSSRGASGAGSASVGGSRLAGVLGQKGQSTDWRSMGRS